jgi:hypothetical protein
MRASTSVAPADDPWRLGPLWRPRRSASTITAMVTMAMIPATFTQRGVGASGGSGSVTCALSGDTNRLEARPRGYRREPVAGPGVTH